MTSPANPCQRAQRERVLKTGLPVLKTGISTAETLLTATTPLGQSAESPSRAQEPALPRKATAETSSFSAGFRTRGVGSTTPLTGTSATPGPCDAVAHAGSLASRPLAAHSSPYFARPQQGRFPLRWNFFHPGGIQSLGRANSHGSQTHRGKDGKACWLKARRQRPRLPQKLCCMSVGHFLSE